MKNFNHPLILASNSPRRQELLRDAGFDFKVKTRQVDENYPSDLPSGEVASFLALKKAQAYQHDLNDEVLITADTVVNLKGTIMGKPVDHQMAEEMLQALSGNEHEVTTGVCIATKNSEIVFSDTTKVFFRPLTAEEITYYIDNFQPFDKAGAYGIQEWIGMVGITKIEGSYFNVVGLPVHKVYDALMTMDL